MKKDTKPSVIYSPDEDASGFDSIAGARNGLRFEQRTTLSELKKGAI